MNITVIALVMAPMPAGARSAPQAKSAKGITELTVAMPAIFSHSPGVNWARARHRNGSSTSPPSSKRVSTRGSGPKSDAATRMKRNEPPQMAPSTVSSNGVRQAATALAGAAAARSRGALPADFTVQSELDMFGV